MNWTLLWYFIETRAQRLFCWMHLHNWRYLNDAPGKVPTRRVCCWCADYETQNNGAWTLAGTQKDDGRYDK